MALDIDETLAWTVHDWIEIILGGRENPEGLTVVELAGKYPHSSYFPDYLKKVLTPSKQQELIYDNELQKRLTPMPYANTVMNEVGLKIALYLTIRPQEIYTGTVEFLEKNDFARAPIMMKPHGMDGRDGNRWKAHILNEMFPHISAIIDDSHDLARELHMLGYGGKQYLINSIPPEKDIPHVIYGENWLQMKEKLIQP